MTWLDWLFFFPFSLNLYLLMERISLVRHVARLQRIVEGFSARIVAQSELLSKKAEKKPADR